MNRHPIKVGAASGVVVALIGTVISAMGGAPPSALLVGAVFVTVAVGIIVGLVDWGIARTERRL